MLTDQCKRLRDAAYLLRNAYSGSMAIRCGEHGAAIANAVHAMEEAADTIEGLRERLQRETCHPTMWAPVPEMQTGCSECGTVWDPIMGVCGFDGPPRYCPGCGRQVVG